MQIRVGYEMVYQCYQPTPMILSLTIHSSRSNDLVKPDRIVTDPPVPVHGYHDTFGNWCSRVVAPPGRFMITSDAVVNDTGKPDEIALNAEQAPVEQLPDDTLLFLLQSRYCETDLLSNMAWQQFGSGPTGWARVQAICDFVNKRIQFGYHNARRTRTAAEAYNEGVGVCRDYAHLAITLCRCMNIPARYCNGFLGDIGMQPPYGPMDFAAWIEVFLGGRWYTFDPRNHQYMPRIGRVLIARGRDAADVALASTFGPNLLEGFKVWTDEVVTAPAMA